MAGAFHSYFSRAETPRHNRSGDRSSSDSTDGATPTAERWFLRRRVVVPATTLLAGVAALVWLLVRTGTRPSRLTYLCQQSALAMASAAFGGPVVAAVVTSNATLLRYMKTVTGRITTALLVVVAGLMLGVSAYEPDYPLPIAGPSSDYHPPVYLVKSARDADPDRFGGVDDLVTLMGTSGLKWYRSDNETRTSGADGLIDVDDVVLIKINAQWPERGGTNTDVLRGVIRRIVEHPDGFTGEIVVADNGQGSGSLNRAQNNAVNRGQSPQDVVNDFAAEGWQVSTKLWDLFRYVATTEFSTGDLSDGYIVSSVLDPETSIRVSYPKFRTAHDTCISYKHGVWDTNTSTYDADRLVVINMPVLKTHYIYGVTAAVKNHMGVVTTGQSTRSHSGVGRGGMGSVLAEVRMPDLTILDCIWVQAHPGEGPWALYEEASWRNQLVAGTDPVALDIWAVTNILVPEITLNGYTLPDYTNGQDPDNPSSSFRRYLDRSMNEMLVAGIPATNVAGAVIAHIWAGDFDEDGDLDGSDHAEFAFCLAGPDGPLDPTCRPFDFDDDDHSDLADFARFQTSYTGPARINS